ncbi:MAG: hypothetical protein IKI99_00045 [Firmicutes bacterium]|nr:hypothetical protein [Bacillota bacterium]
MRNVRIVAIQIGWTEDKDDNLRRTLALIDKAMTVHSKADLICLPEMYYTNPTRKNLDTIGMPLWNPLTIALADYARKYHVNIVTGCFPWKSRNGLYNTCLCLDRDGAIVEQYSKTHLFDGLGLKESDLVKAGDEICIVDFDFGRVGMAICYELRFPEYLTRICKEGVELLCIPTAFYRPRTENWDVLTRAAALQNQVFVCAVNQCNRFYLGKSRIVDPDGRVLAEIEEGEGFAYVEADLNQVAELQEKLGKWKNRREELY